MTSNERYKQLLQDAWDGSRSPDQPSKPPTKFAVGFYAGLFRAVWVITGKRPTLSGNIIGVLDKVKETYDKGVTDESRI